MVHVYFLCLNCVKECRQWPKLSSFHMEGSSKKVNRLRRLLKGQGDHIFSKVFEEPTVVRTLKFVSLNPINGL